MEKVYLDNAATTPLHPGVLAAMTEALSMYANPSSLHALGLEAEKMVEGARAELADLLEVAPENLVFTSGGTEANNLALKGFLARSQRRGLLVTSEIEHPSVLEVFAELKSQGWEVCRLPVDSQGQVQLSALEAALKRPVQLVSLMAVNNETGSIQPLAQAVDLVRARQPRAAIHTDAVQALGKIPFAPARLGVDFASVSAHKIHGPKGVGALYLSRRDRLFPLLQGGGQEGGLRSGTENVPGIVGFGRAARELLADPEEKRARVAALRQRFLAGIEGLPCRVISPGDGAPHIFAVSFPGFRGEVLLQALSALGVYVSTGAACSGKKGGLSQVAQAMGLDREVAEGLLRFSFSWLNTEAEIDYAGESVKKVLADLAFVRGRRS